ncbi:hypothetical protein PQU92_09350 [Asticcacaulis sp. BYS171W]|uniref:Uncharacterized protein n=1 Tax=Asticcacaulis aquaticus TaxID=2984212 RepID=A0ABT5HUF8_9CAUL|nr:hypothetical protein [Asticcacaulis aquaticus]MDC7683480.1 hypothetical protein [Asticcacaulis aquaticus]
MFKRMPPLVLASALSFGALAATPVLMAAPAVADDVQKEVSADQAFPFLSKFLALPIAERDEITVAYLLKIKNGSARDGSIILKHNGQSQKLSILGDGRITPLPTLAQLRGGKIVLTGPKDMSVAMKVRIYATETPAKTMPAAPLIKAVDQSGRVLKKIAGALFALAPKPDRVYFVGAGNARVVMADGSQKILPRSAVADAYPAGTPYFVPSEYQGAVSFTFDNVPSRIGIDDRAK